METAAKPVNANIISDSIDVEDHKSAIKSVEVLKGVNYGSFDIVLTLNCLTKDVTPEMKSIGKVDAEGRAAEVYYGENELGFIHFGLLMEDPEHRPTGNTQFWSSNSEFISSYVGYDVVEILVIPSDSYHGSRTFGLAMRISRLNELLEPQGIKLVWKKARKDAFPCWCPVPLKK